MNKRSLTFLMAIMIATLLSIGFASCSSDDDEDSFSVKGSTYAAYAYRGGGMFDSDYYDVYWVYKFTSDTQYEKTTRQSSISGGIIGDIETGTYVLNYPNITIKAETGILKGSVTSGTFVDKNTFRVGSGSNVMEYTKQ